MSQKIQNRCLLIGQGFCLCQLLGALCLETLCLKGQRAQHWHSHWRSGSPEQRNGRLPIKVNVVIGRHSYHRVATSMHETLAKCCNIAVEFKLAKFAWQEQIYIYLYTTKPERSQNATETVTFLVAPVPVCCDVLPFVRSRFCKGLSVKCIWF